tara:strand:+ start:469 stop:744 length:276 start_codon:yes stop_codon:yes gene_type:complete
MQEQTTAKDDLYIEARDEFDVTLDRRMTLDEMQDQVDRLKENGKDPVKVLPKRTPKLLRNVVTGVEWPYCPEIAGNADLEVIEWESADGDD